MGCGLTGGHTRAGRDGVAARETQFQWGQRPRKKRKPKRLQKQHPTEFHAVITEAPHGAPPPAPPPKTPAAPTSPSTTLTQPQQSAFGPTPAAADRERAPSSGGGSIRSESRRGRGKRKTGKRNSASTLASLPGVPSPANGAGAPLGPASANGSVQPIPSSATASYPPVPSSATSTFPPVPTSANGSVQPIPTSATGSTAPISGGATAGWGRSTPSPSSSGGFAGRVQVPPEPLQRRTSPEALPPSRDWSPPAGPLAAAASPGLFLHAPAGASDGPEFTPQGMRFNAGSGMGDSAISPVQDEHNGGMPKRPGSILHTSGGREKRSDSHKRAAFASGEAAEGKPPAGDDRSSCVAYLAESRLISTDGSEAAAYGGTELSDSGVRGGAGRPLPTSTHLTASVLPLRRGSLASASAFSGWGGQGVPSEHTEATERPEAPPAVYRPGDCVRVRDYNNEAWQLGTVLTVDDGKPVVLLDIHQGTGRTFQWRHIEPCGRPQPGGGEPASENGEKEMRELEAMRGGSATEEVLAGSMSRVRPGAMSPMSRSLRGSPSSFRQKGSTHRPRGPA
eukprot:TRINITY_DN6002_c1_g2_i1.p1 TRINITY_DN6002_c1_g2~~TRINITY_DN6002_c1_g2_i1.p1  ORF type:complete len:565 (+),score=78.78 TRINITY_DN6002_c1_g2_i1:134-1828(+)